MPAPTERHLVQDDFSSARGLPLDHLPSVAGALPTQNLSQANRNPPSFGELLPCSAEGLLGCFSFKQGHQKTANAFSLLCQTLKNQQELDDP